MDIKSGSGQILTPGSSPSFGSLTLTPAVLWSARGTATDGKYQRIKDATYNLNSLFQGDGAFWKPVGELVLAQSAVAASITGTLTETTLATVLVPSSMLGLNGTLRITTRWSSTSSANSKTERVRFGGNVLSLNAQTTQNQAKFQAQVHNRNAANSQITDPGNNFTGFAVTPSTWQTFTVDTTADVTILLTAQLTNTGETIVLEEYIVEVLF